jgi:hypothetical protein
LPSGCFGARKSLPPLISALTIFTMAGWVLAIANGYVTSPISGGFAAFGFISVAYCGWAVTFSKKVRAELARRREANKIPDRAASQIRSGTSEAAEARD